MQLKCTHAKRILVNWDRALITKNINVNKVLYPLIPNKACAQHSDNCKKDDEPCPKKSFSSHALIIVPFRHFVQTIEWVKSALYIDMVVSNAVYYQHLNSKEEFTMKKKWLFSAIAILMIIAIVAPVTMFVVMSSPNPHPVVRAIPTAAEQTTVQTTHNGETRDIQMPQIYDYFTDGIYNYFLFSIGSLQHTYLSTIFTPTFHPGGNVTINMSRTETTQEAVTTGLTQSVSNSMSVTTSLGTTVSASASIQVGPSVARTNASVGVSTNFSVTASATNTRSWQTSLTEAVTHGRLWSNDKHKCSKRLLPCRTICRYRYFRHTYDLL